MVIVQTNESNGKGTWEKGGKEIKERKNKGEIL
jgi:hypothetical protein